MEWLVERGPKIESSRDKAKRVGQMFDSIAKDYGPQVVTEFTQLLEAARQRGEVPKGQDIAKLLASHETRDEFATKSQARLRKLGILSDHGFSLAQFTNRKRKFADLLDPEDEAFANFRGEYLANTFGDQPIMLADKPEDGIKQLVYAPQTKEQAFNVDAIKAADFHLGYWEFPGWLPKENIETTTAPRTLDNSKALETAVAAILYNPKFGDAKRNAAGKLEVRYPDGKYRAITSEWLGSQSGLGIKNEQGKPIFERPLAALKEYCPTLFTEGLLRDSDFTASRHQTRTRLEASVVPQAGILAINGVKHNLGRTLGGHTVRVEQLTPEQSAIVLDEDGVLSPISLINRFNKGDSRLKTYDNGKGAISYAASAELTQPTLLILADTNQNPELKAAIDNLHVWTKLNNQLRAAGFDVDQSLPLNTREHFRRNVSKLAPYTEQILTLTRDIGDIGLQSVAEISDLPDIAREYLRVAAELRSNEATLLAESVVEAGNTRRQMLAEVASAVTSGTMTPEQGRVAKYELTRRVASAITAMEDVARTATLQDKPTLEVLKNNLAKKNSDFQLFSSVYRSARQDGALPIETLNGLDITSKNATELSDDELPAMEDMLRQNWSQQKPEAVTNLAADLRDRTKAGQDITYYLLHHNSKLSGFVSFDAKNPSAPDGVYADAFNVDADLQSSGIGRAFLENVLKTESRKHNIYAHANPDSPVVKMYTKDFGMKIIGTDYEDIDGQQVAWTKLVLPRATSETGTSGA